MPDDLHLQLRTSVTSRLETARAATPGPWQHVDFADPSGQPMTSDGERSTFMGCGSVITLGEHVMGGDIAAPSGDLYPRSGYSPKEDMAHIAANDPQATIARCEALLRVLDRIHSHAQMIAAYAQTDEDDRDPGEVLSDDDLYEAYELILLDMAAGEGIEVTE